VKLLSARWVVPIDGPPIAEGRSRSATTARCWPVGRRAELRAEFPDAVEERAQGVLLPGPGQRAFPPGAVRARRRRPGRQGLFAWATTLMGARKADLPDRQRETAATAAAAAVALGTAAVGDVGNSLAAAPGIGRAGLAGVLFHELFESREIATGDALADAARERAEAAAGWPERLGYVPAPHAPFSVGPELLARIFAAAAAAGRATSIHVAEDEDELALLRDGSGRWPALLAGMGVDPATRVPRKSPVAYLASLGAFETATPPLLVHMVHAGADDRRIARDGRRDRRALPALEPAHRRPPPRRRRVRRRRPAARHRHRQPRVRTRPVVVGRDGHAGRALPRRHGGALAGRRHPRRRARSRPARIRHARSRRASRRARRAGRRHRRPARIAGPRSNPDLRWVAPPS
jgi:hypothetical protein